MKNSIPRVKFRLVENGINGSNSVMKFLKSHLRVTIFDYYQERFSSHYYSDVFRHDNPPVSWHNNHQHHKTTAHIA